jgi:hypothetical protein
LTSVLSRLGLRCDQGCKKSIKASARRGGQPDHMGKGAHVLQHRHRTTQRPERAGFSCPGCGATTADSYLIRIGCCGTCLQFTGLCSVGRDISLSGIALDMGELCSAFGVALWDFDGIGRRLVCRLHDKELSDRRYVWIQGTRAEP